VDLRKLLGNISGRERGLIIGALAVLFIFLVYQFLYFPLIKTRDGYRSEIVELENRYASYRLLTQRYIAEKSRYDSVVEKLKLKQSLSVLTYLENQASIAGIRESIDYIRPRGTETRDGIVQSSVEIKVDAIPPGDLLLFLQGIERNRDGLVVSYLRLKPFFKERDKMDAIVVITDVTAE